MEPRASDKLLNEYSFTLLREEAIDTDAFEDKTHDKIASTLHKLVKQEKGGVTVGLTVLSKIPLFSFHLAEVFRESCNRLCFALLTI